MFHFVFRKISFAFLILCWAVFGFQDLQAQTRLTAPRLQQTGLLTVSVSAGQVLNEGRIINVTAASLTMTASLTNCGSTATSLANCNYIYAPSAGGAALSTATASTALAAGNVVLGTATTSATAITTLIVSSTTPSLFDGPVTINCGSSATCATPTWVGSTPTTIVGTGLAVVLGTATVSGLPAGTYLGCGVVLTATVTSSGTAVCTVNGTTLTITMPISGASTPVSWWALKI